MTPPKEVLDALKLFEAKVDPDGIGILTKDGCYTGEFGNDNTTVKESIKMFVGTDLMGACGCGRFESFCEKVYSALRLYHLLKEESDKTSVMEIMTRLTISDEHRRLYEELEKEDILCRWFDSLGWSEHGSQYPGWLEEKGNAAYTLLDYAFSE